MKSATESELSSSRALCAWKLWELELLAPGSGPLSGDSDPSTHGPHLSWQSKPYLQKVLGSERLLKVALPCTGMSGTEGARSGS